MGDISGKKYEVLIVDDSETNRSILAEILSEEYNITEADSGEKAVEILQRESNEFSLVLLDVIMPGMDGIETVRRIRRVIGNEAPIIILTAYDWTDIEEEARERATPLAVRKKKSRVSSFDARYP